MLAAVRHQVKNCCIIRRARAIDRTHDVVTYTRALERPRLRLRPRTRLRYIHLTTLEPVEQATVWFERLFAPGRPQGAFDDDSVVSLWLGRGHASHHIPVRLDARKLAECALAHAAAGRDVYAGIATRKPDLNPFQRGKKTELRWARAFWLDVDVRAPGHAADNLPPTIEHAADLIDAIGLDLEPSLVVDSGGGLHAYWILDTPHPLATPADVRAFEDTLKALQQRAIAAGRARGWHVDSTADATRVLRVPGTFNRKAEPRAVQIIVDEVADTTGVEASA